MRPRVAWGVGVQAHTAVIDGQAGSSRRLRAAQSLRLHAFHIHAITRFRTVETLHSHAREFTVLALPFSAFTLLGSNPPYLAISYVAKY